MSDKLLLLGILRQHEMHGYQLYEYIDQGLAACTDLKKPTAYYLLNKMAQDGWVSEEITQEGNRPPRKVYRLTPGGEAAFQRLLRHDLETFDRQALVGDSCLAFLDELSPAEALPLLHKRRAGLAEALAAAHSAPQHPGSLQLVLEHQRQHLTSELGWLDSVIARIEQYSV